MLKKTIEDYNLIADEFSSKRDRPWPEIKFLFDNYIEPEDKVLDLGCGNGRFFEFCKNKNADYFGADPSEKLIAIAKSRYPEAKFQTTDALKLPFPNNYFDKIYSIAVLHHIPSKELRLRFLEEAKRVLKPKGLLIVTVWRFHQLKQQFLILKFNILKLFRLSKLDFGDILEPWGETTKRYYHVFAKKELVRLSQKSGFKIEDLGVAKNERGNRQNIYLVAEK